MEKSIAMLTQQIQRLLISDEDRERLIKELQESSEERKEELAQLIHDHDEEALEILNKKTAEVEQVKSRLHDAIPDDAAAVSEEEMKGFVHELKEIFQDTNRLAELIAVSDDLVLTKLQEVIEAGLEDSPEMIQEAKEFFAEVRLQKVAFEKDDEKKQKELLIEGITARRAENERLDKLIKKSEKILGKKYL